MKKKRKLTPHCGSAWHFQRCLCRHERQYHTEHKNECNERTCICLNFVLAPGYPKVEHKNFNAHE